MHLLFSILNNVNKTTNLIPELIIDIRNNTIPMHCTIKKLSHLSQISLTMEITNY
jgi:hypothetical protein